MLRLFHIAHLTGQSDLRKSRSNRAIRPRRSARCAKAPAVSTTRALLYLMPRSLGVDCSCSPNVTLFEPSPDPKASEVIQPHPTHGLVESLPRNPERASGF